ncbi:MAG: ferrous iron transport protein B [Bacteroidetes bacterium]|nr:ferrous iron transport protein B [Bacteroidota bacterium]MBU1484276.1 ferrous iron transport protein B [Bacteroidota bacterium]MBU2267570.1 ferrous iron transport protein B [Bacteroidota bacterium]MBU2377059.1 ferrous iron transport protein B [Bacteroidota bacterium]
MKNKLRVALVGNPNTGKSTIFNALTGLNQKIGNFPGVTVDKKSGVSKLADGRAIEIVDLPGTYSLYPKSADETIVFEVLSDKNNSSHPDVVVIVADATNLKRNLLLYTQISDLGLPVIIALNMMDLALKSNMEIDVDTLAKLLNVQVVELAARKSQGIEGLKKAIEFQSLIPLQNSTIDVEVIAPDLIKDLSDLLGVDNPYVALQIAHQYKNLKYLSKARINQIESLKEKYDFHTQKSQAAETIARYNYINEVLIDTVTYKSVALEENISNKIDHYLTHKVWGFVIFIAILFAIFQSIFAWSEYPMAIIETVFVWLAEMGHQYLPSGILTDLLVDGVLAGLSGVMVFIPQIALLFAFISILEDTGYMSRVTFMMDRLMRKVGLNGRSVVPLIGGLACAVPSIMSARTIENWKDRIITIMVTPLVSCSARLPIYTLLISLVVPKKMLLGFINLQGIALMSIYFLSVFMAILVAWVMKGLIRSKLKGYFIMELPVYRMPRWNNVGITMLESVKTFVTQAGKVIIAVSIILWVLASYGPSNKFDKIDQKYQSTDFTKNYSADQIKRFKSSEKLENSYAGLLGKSIEPSIKPLGFDWKIGIALITSFAAREVFVGTMATLYSVDGDASKMESVKEKMANAKNTETGLTVFTTATAFSLMIFYAFAMQCMSTMAVVYRETKNIKWPLIQFAYMLVLAYVSSFVVYQLLS